MSTRHLISCYKINFYHKKQEVEKQTHLFACLRASHRQAALLV